MKYLVLGKLHITLMLVSFNTLYNYSWHSNEYGDKRLWLRLFNLSLTIGWYK